MLIWIKGALSPAEIRKKMLQEDGEFQKAMIAYLEAAHVGEFLTGTLQEVKSKVPYAAKSRRGLHDIVTEEVRTTAVRDYKDPTQTLPKAPPPFCECGENGCTSCEELGKYWKDYNETVDDLILRSNVHTCRSADGKCNARFPRPLHMHTEVDPTDGHINVKKREPMINTVTPAVTYTHRCNSDTTSLLSGTSIKAVVAYISDYVTKGSLRIYHMFETVKDVLNKNTISMGSSATSQKIPAILSCRWSTP
ncbi:hypothetical protein C8R43DRAFT_883628 [Mycena crocata]|nr:hypothetical protein C8R43DRAFT_883628 [Mycena crocata]